MRKWIANKEFLMEDIINYVTPERDYLIVRQVKAGSYIYEYENVDKLIVNRYTVVGDITQGWKMNCALVAIEPETAWGETGGSGGSGEDSSDSSSSSVVSGDGVSVFTNIVRVEPNAKSEVEGKLYKDYASAREYVYSIGHPSETNPWVIELPSGEFSEDIDIPEHVSILGHHTVLVGVVGTRSQSSSKSFESTVLVEDCVVKSLKSYSGQYSGIDLRGCIVDLVAVSDDSENGLTLFLDDCKIKSGSVVSTVNVCSHDCKYVGATVKNVESMNDDFISCVINGGFFRGCGFKSCEFHDGVFSVDDGILESCIVKPAMNGSRISCSKIGVSTNFLFDSYTANALLLENCVIAAKNFYVFANASVQDVKVVNLVDCSFRDASDSVVPPIGYVTFSSGRMANVGAYYDNSVKNKLSANDVQGAIDELIDKIDEAKGNLKDTYVGTDPVGTGNNVLEVGESRIWLDSTTLKVMLVSRVDDNKYVQVELN